MPPAAITPRQNPSLSRSPQARHYLIFDAPELAEIINPATLRSAHPLMLHEYSFPAAESVAQGDKVLSFILPLQLSFSHMACQYRVNRQKEYAKHGLQKTNPMQDEVVITGY